MTGRPLVSICIPTYNGGRWIDASLRSALSQEYDPIEVVVVDDCSTDDTLERIRQTGDPRLRVARNDRNLGLVRNWNECVRRCRGELVKFLFQDDLLLPGCVPRMVDVFEASPRTGMVFSRREVLMEDPSDPRAVLWKERYGTLHTQFERINAHNEGRELFRQYLKHGFRMNWVGEPSCVMLRRACFERLGLFHTRMFQGPDFEMWIRVMYFYDVGFLDEPLAAFRLHSGSTSRENDRRNRSWLDLLWLLEGLLEHEEIRREHPEIGRLRLWEAARVVRSELRRLRSGRVPAFGYQVRSLAEYAGFRIASALGRAPSLHERIA